MEGQIFGSDITLPSLPGLQSDCEEEILLLMKEVDLEFHRKHHALLTELINVRSLCRAQRDEIEKLRMLLQTNSEITPNEKDEDKIKKYCSEIEKLKEENLELKSEKDAMQQKIQRLSDIAFQLESLKRSLSIQQEENKSLKNRLSKVGEQYQSLQSGYKKVVKTLTSLSQNSGNHGRIEVNDGSAISIRETEIADTTAKFLSEEKQFCNDFLQNINKEIDNLEKRLQKEVS